MLPFSWLVLCHDVILCRVCSLPFCHVWCYDSLCHDTYLCQVCSVMWHWWHDINLCQVCSTVCQVMTYDAMTVCHDIKLCLGCSLSCDNSLCHDIKLWQVCSMLYYVWSHERLCHDGSMLKKKCTLCHVTFDDMTSILPSILSMLWHVVIFDGMTLCHVQVCCMSWRHSVPSVLLSYVVTSWRVMTA